MATTHTQHDDPTRTTTRHPGAQLATLGLLLVAAGPAIVVAADPGAAPFVAPVILLGLVGAFLARTFGTWAKVVAVLIGVMALANAASGPPRIGLGRPDSVLDFLPAWMLLLGGVLAIGGGVWAIARRESADGGLGRRVAVGVLALLAVMAIGSTIASVAGDDGLTDTELAAADLVIVLTDAVFTPDDVRAAAGATVAIVNEGRMLHTFTVDELGIDHELAPGQSALVSVPDRPGVLDFYCRPHSALQDGAWHGMAGRLTVS